MFHVSHLSDLYGICLLCVMIMAPLGALVDSMVQTGKQAAGAAQPQVGEGTRDMPVGTMLAMLDQAAKLQNAVHKRMHAAQCEEFRLLVECFKEHP